MAFVETAKLAVRIDLEGNASAGVQKLSRQFAGLNTSSRRVSKGIGQIGSGFTRAGLIVGGAAVTGLTAVAKAAIDFEDAFAGVRKTVDETDLKSAGLTFEDISDSLRKMSREMPNSAIELAGIAETAGALGIKAKDIEAFTKQVAILASTTDISADDAATGLGQLQNVIGLTGDEFDNFAAALVDLGNKGASTESQILEITRRAGGAAKLVGIAKEETLGWGAAAANLGLQSEIAGTALQTFFQESLKIVANGKKPLEQFSKVAGMTAKEFKTAFKKDASGALESFIRGLGDLPKDQRLKTVQTFFGKRSGLTRLILGLADSIDQNLDPSLETSVKAWEEAAAAQAEFDKRNATVKSAILRLRNNIIDAAVTIGEGFAPALGRAADKLSAFLSLDGNRSELKKLGEDIGQAIDGINWTEVLQGAKDFMGVMRVAFDWAKRIFDTFNALPTEIKGATAGFLALNKLSGGLIAGGIGNIVGGLGGGLASGLASRAPGVGKLFAQPVFVTNWPVGGLGGGAGGVVGGGGSKLGKALAGASIIGDIAAVIATQQEVSGQSTAQAAEIKAGLDSSIAGKSLPELSTALSGVQDGINQLQSNPLYAIVQGDALTTLKQMEADLKTAIAQKSPASQQTETAREGRKGAAFGTTGKDKKPLADIKTATDKVKAQTATSGKELNSGIKETKRETAKGAAFTSATVRTSTAIQTGAIVGAIWAAQPHITVNVTGNSVSSSNTRRGRYGSQTGSRNADWTDYGRGGVH